MLSVRINLSDELDDCADRCHHLHTAAVVLFQQATALVIIGGILCVGFGYRPELLPGLLWSGGFFFASSLVRLIRAHFARKTFKLLVHRDWLATQLSEIRTRH